jgi:hypothetical protein
MFCQPGRYQNYKFIAVDTPTWGIKKLKPPL